MSMFGARFAVFVRRARVLPGPCPATRNLSFWRFHRRRDTVDSTCCFTELVRVRVEIPQDGNRTNMRNGVVTVVLAIQLVVRHDKSLLTFTGIQYTHLLI